jgi:FkbM family methyltransferase
MKTKHKILFAKIISNLITFIYKNKVLTKRSGIYWSLNLNEGIDLSLFLFGKFENSILEVSKYLIKNKNVDILDIGSNMGVHSLRLAKIFKNSIIYSIEPTDFAYKKLLKNVSLNNEIKNIKTSQYFITAKNIKPKKIYSSWELETRNKQHKKHYGTLKTTRYSEAISLDKFLKEKKIDKKILIKCDVDGNELEVFKSGKNFLKKHKPYIIMELAPYLYPEYGYNVNKLLNLLEEYNYKFYDAKNYSEIKNIYKYANNINDGSSENIFLK